MAPTEIICDPTPLHRAAVTFRPEVEIVDTVRANLVAACTLAVHGAPDGSLANALLDHIRKGVRLRKVLGRYRDLERLRAGPRPPSAEALERQQAAQAHLQRFVDEVRAVAEPVRDSSLGRGAVAGLDTEHLGLVGDEVERAIVASPGFPGLLQALLEQVRARIAAAVTVGTLEADRRGWPIPWTHESVDRAHFLTALETFTGNRAQMLGSLLTPLVNGVRVRGPFGPTWADRVEPLVLIDTQGLGHETPGTVRASSLSLGTLRAMRVADGIVLVDHALNRMLEQPQLVVRTAAQMGLSDRVFLVFSHLDEVVHGGGCVESREDAGELVWASVNNVLAGMAAEIGPPAAPPGCGRGWRARPGMPST